MQCQEVLEALPQVEFELIFVKTHGDLDRSTSLRTLGATDFFTRELDQMVLNYECQIAIHSAKDLPDPLLKGLKIVAITKGIDPSDVLVTEALKPGMVVATSSERREEAVRQLVDAHFVDIRGTIEERLEKWKKGEVDGVVIAKAALIRLGIEVPMIELPGETAPLQGKLAIVAREDDHEMEELCKPLCTQA